MTMRGDRRRAKGGTAAFGAAVFLVAACSAPEGAFQRCESGTVADKPLGECIRAGGSGGQGGAAGASGGGQAGVDAACEPTRLATDAKNCGVCGRDCRGAPCQGGACQPELLADRLTAPYALALDGANVFWASPAKGIASGAGASIFSLVRSAPVGTTPSPLFDGAIARTRSLARAPNGELFWADLDVGAVLRRAQGVAQATALATGRADVNQLVVAGDYVYWTQGALAASRAEGAVARAPLAGGAAQSLANMQLRPDALAVDGETACWVNRGPDGQVMRVKAGEPPELIERVGDPIAVAAGPGRVVWAERASGRVALLAEGAASATTLVRDASELVEGIALEGELMYRVTFRPAERMLLLKRSALDGTSDVLLARVAPADAGYAGNPLGAFVLAFDETYLYLADPGSASVDEAGVPLSQQNGRLYRTPR